MLGKGPNYIAKRNPAVIGDRCGDRLQTTYHRSESMMNKGIRKVGDRLKEDFRFFIWKRVVG